MDGKGILKHVRIILLIDWPSKDVPETLARAGFRVFVHGGPAPDDYSVYELDGGEIVSRRTGRPPDQADLVYSYRPLAELAQTIDQANAVAAKFLWMQSGLSPDGRNDPKGCWLPDEDSKSAERQVQAAGLQLITEPYIADVAVDREIF
jgi:predicted CoA-binding protein